MHLIQANKWNIWVKMQKTGQSNIAYFNNKGELICVSPLKDQAKVCICSLYKLGMCKTGVDENGLSCIYVED